MKLRRKKKKRKQQKKEKRQRNAKVWQYMAEIDVILCANILKNSHSDHNNYLLQNPCSSQSASTGISCSLNVTCFSLVI